MKACLVVDDSRVIRLVARRILDELGFAVEEAENGQQALDACANRLPDAVLLDFLRAMRAKYGAGPKVVFCTTENDLDHIRAAIDAGADEYIMKPFDRDIVEAKFTQVGLL